MNEQQARAAADAFVRIQGALRLLMEAADLMVWLEKQDQTPHEANLDLAIDMCRVASCSLKARILRQPAEAA